MVRLETTKGNIDVELDEKNAPKSVANFLQYVRAGHYDNTVFHRVVSGFMIQGGGFSPGMKQKQTRAPIVNEADNGLKNDRYTLSMARTGDPHSASAQFFINVADNDFLNYRSKDSSGYGYAVFGKVVNGRNVVDKIAAVPTASRGFHQDVPVEDITILKAAEQKDPDEQKTLTTRLYLDGSNLLLGVTWNGEPKVALFAAIFYALQSAGYECFAIFDQSVRHRLKGGKDGSETRLLDELVAASKGRITFEKVADPHLLLQAQQTSGQVVSHSDRYRTWTSRFPQGLPPMVSVSQAGGVVTFYFESQPEKSFSAEVKTSTALFGMSLSLQSSPPTSSSKGAEMRILPTENMEAASTDARLVVFVLDASGSMCDPTDKDATDTFDHKLKSLHVTDLLRSTMARLATSVVSDSIYVAVINFAGDVTVHQFSGSHMVHIDRAQGVICDSRFDYTREAHGRGTNIGKALKSAVELIDGALGDEKNQDLAITWHALIVLITDGAETVDTRALQRQVANLSMSRSTLTENQIRVACVGIGQKIDQQLLSGIASPATQEQMGRFRKAGQHGYLLKTPSGQPALFVHVNKIDPNFKDVIRNFIDIASTTVR